MGVIGWSFIKLLTSLLLVERIGRFEGIVWVAIWIFGSEKESWQLFSSKEFRRTDPDVWGCRFWLKVRLWSKKFQK